MLYINELSNHPDLRYRDKYQYTLKEHIQHEIEELELSISSSTQSHAESIYHEQKKLELFRRVFGF